MDTFYLYDSDDNKFQFKIVVNGKAIYFGDKHCKYYTMSRNVKSKLDYIKSHNNFWENDNFETSDFWVRWLLFNKTTVEKSIEDVEKRFKIKIISEVKLTPLKRISHNYYNTIRKTDRTISTRILDILA